MKKIMLTGKDGQVGWELQKSLASAGHLFAYDRKQLDLQNPDAISKVIRELKPDVIINAAAYTAVDQAEKEKEAAYAINAVAPGIMAEEAKKCGAILIHYSTDYVFDGSSKVPYKETDATAPLNVYGETKLAGEKAILAVHGKALILRTSWVYGMRGKNFLLTMLRLGKEKSLLKIVNDQIGAPTWSRSIAETTTRILDHLASSRDLHSDSWGIYHLTAAGQTSWFDFSQEIFAIHKRLASLNSLVAIPELQPIPTSEYPTPAKRPAYSVLSNNKLLQRFQLNVPDWREEVYRCMTM